MLFNLQPFLNKFYLTFDMKIVKTLQTEVIFLYQTKTKFAGDRVRLTKYTRSYLEAHNCESRELAILSDFSYENCEDIANRINFLYQTKTKIAGD